MNAVTDARYGLCFDVETTNFADFANPGKNDEEFHAAAMLMKSNCERIMEAIKGTTQIRSSELWDCLKRQSVKKRF